MGIALPQYRNFQDELGSAFGNNLADLIPARLGNPSTLEILVTDTDRDGLVYIHGLGDDPQSANTAVNNIPFASRFLSYDLPVLVKRETNGYVVKELDYTQWATFFKGVANHDQSPVTVSQMTWGTIQATNPPSEYIKANGAYYTYGGTSYRVGDMLSSNYATWLMSDTTPIVLPSAPNRATAVCVFVDVTTNQFVFEQTGTEFDAVLSHASAFDNGYYYNTLDTTMPYFRLGWVRFTYGMTTIANNAVLTSPEYLLRSSTNGTVTSVGLALPSEFTVTNSPVTTSGTLTGAWASQTTNKFFASPNGSTGTPTFRAIAKDDLTTALTTPPDIGTTTPALGYFSKVGVNDTPSATEQLAVQAGSATVIPLTVQGASAQSANLVNITDSTPSILALFDANGWLGVGSTPSARTATIATERTTTGTGAQRALYTRINANHSVAPASTSMRGFESIAETVAGNATSFTGLVLYGSIMTTNHRGSGTLGNMYGSLYTNVILSGAGNVTLSAGFASTLTNVSTSTVTTGIGAQIGSATNSGGGAITTFYGVKIENQTVAGTNYAIHTGTGLVVFNENGDSGSDVRIEGDTKTNLLFTDASADSVGIITSTPNSRLQVNGSLSLPIVSKSADYTATIDDYCILVNATATITLPTAVGISGRMYTIKNIASGITVTVDANSTETIDGALTQVITAQWTSITIISDNANWYII